MTLRYGSVCSGIEAATVAWRNLGWKAAWLSEIEPFPCAVLEHHYPDVPNLGDMTTLPKRIESGEVEAPDVFCGGTPCQAFSVAGLRKSLDDARGNLSLTFCEIANAIDNVRRAGGKPPAIIFWENVPGVLSTKDNAFGCFLAGIAGEDDPVEPPGGKWTNAGCVFGPERAVAWRVLDAQYFGVAQRRRRVFVVASAREGFDPAAVLFEFDGMRRDSAPSREAGQRVAPCVTNGPPFSRTGNERVECEAIITMAHGQGGAEIGFDRGPTLTCNHEAPIAAYGIRTANTSSNGWGIQEEVTHTLDTAQGVAVATMAVALRGREGGATAELGDEVGHALRASSGGGDKAHVLAPVVQPIGWSEELTASVDVAGTIQYGGQGGRHDGVMTPAMQVRRLTPVECERLQGFPDGYTMIPWRNKPASECPDGPRYKALGNSWAVPVVRWIGHRIHNAIFGQP